MPAIKEVFPRAQKAQLWLVNFERTLAWMCIRSIRAFKRYRLRMDPMTGENVLEVD